MKTFSDVARDRNNHFNLIRVSAALAVMVVHYFWLTKAELPIDGLLRRHHNLTSGAMTVDVLFSVSGFLITASLFNRHGAAVLALVSDPAWAPELPARRLQRAFGWTVAEAEVAREVASGARLSDVAERRGVGIETVRTQLKRVFRKSGVSSQAELVRLVANASASLQADRR